MLLDARLPSCHQETVVEILEKRGGDEDLLEACRVLRDRGYRLALDDYGSEKSGSLDFHRRFP